MGWQVVAEYVDQGISGSKGRDQRPQFDAMLKAATRREVDVIAACNVCGQVRGHDKRYPLGVQD